MTIGDAILDLYNELPPIENIVENYYSKNFTYNHHYYEIKFFKAEEKGFQIWNCDFKNYMPRIVNGSHKVNDQVYCVHKAF